MIIDWHTHVSPPEVALATNMPQMEIEHSLDIHARAGVDLIVVTNPLHYIKSLGPNETLEAIKRSDEFLADIASRHSDRAVCFTSTVPGGDDRYLKQMEVAVKEFGLRGVFIHSSHQGHYPDEDQARPFFELCLKLDLPIFLHAPASSFGEDCMAMYRLISSIGRPWDECLAIARLIVRGVFEQMPDLKLVGAHVGGGISSVIGRMDYAYELGDYVHFLGSYTPMLISRKPSTYLRQMYFDTACYHFPALLTCLLTVGADRLVFGADAPALVPLLPGSIDIVRQLDLTAEQLEDILWRNAAKLLRLPAGK